MIQSKPDGQGSHLGPRVSMIQLLFLCEAKI